MMKRYFIVLCIYLLSTAYATCGNLVDVPTSEVIDYGSFEVNFRFYSQGGILSRLNFGVIRNMNLGVYIDVERLIGSQDISWDELDVPRLYLKFRLYPGGMKWPAIAMGYDAQGYRNYKADNREKARGAYLVLSKELLIPGMHLHLGGNVSLTEEENKFFGFFGTDYWLSETFNLFAEYDRIRNLDSGRLNLGLQYTIGSNIYAYFCVRDILENTIDVERVLGIKYRGIF